MDLRNVKSPLRCYSIAISANPGRGGRIPAVAMTAYARVENRLRDLVAGSQMHVPKPVEPAELAAVVSSLAGRVSNCN
jgi:CheY-like chemotaxis protein